MNQQMSFFDAPLPKTSSLIKPTMGVKSVMENGTMHSTIKYRGEFFHRHLSVGDKVDVYRNLNKPEFFSAKAKTGLFKTKVAGYAKCYALKDVNFHVGTGHERAKETRNRNVHAYARGTLVEAFDGHIKALDGLRAITYHPFEHSHFIFIHTGEPVNEETFKLAVIQGANVWVEA
jgi:hypothetical protein